MISSAGSKTSLNLLRVFIELDTIKESYSIHSTSMRIILSGTDGIPSYCGDSNCSIMALIVTFPFPGWSLNRGPLCPKEIYLKYFGREDRWFNNSNRSRCSGREDRT